ncbi:hypothetical protein [Thiothrix subterranea]|uniref:hypothetical protein n=1 Tax=Thiothrix subterranea TaxID=2735563 RepID=UPI00280BEBBE|nr:hypothetical protein [Thiothrix subterranea]
MKSVASIIVLLTCCMVDAVSAKTQDNVHYTINIPVAISVDTEAIPTPVAAGETLALHWRVYSNNAFRYQFSGTTKDESGNELAYPSLYKKEVDASGKQVADRYEVLDTQFGVEVSDYGSVQYRDQWGKGQMASGNAPDLVKLPHDPLSPSGSMGRIMTADATNEARIALYAISKADAADQSGLYHTEVKLTITAEEQ